ncbi:MAG: PilZ domain-containing protein [Bdellovibrio sp.]|jgi:hypothetical protein
MFNQQWFVMSEGKIRGPFNRESLETELPRLVSPLVWGRGQAEWVPPEKWLKVLIEQETSASRTKNPERLWRIRLGDQELKPMTYEMMIETLQGKADYKDTLIWTEGYSEWREVYQIHKVMDELGVGRRAHPRVPIAGQVLCEGATGSFVARALSISEGGLGMTESSHVKIGEKLKVVLKSPNLFTPLHATAEVVFVGQDGYAGMKFIGPQTESKSAIIEYIKKFLETKSISHG